MIADPIEAVSHPDPYPYYDELARRPTTFDESLGMWVASRAADVAAVLCHPDARVRPPDAEVPPALSGTPPGDTFGRLVRMNDRPDRPAVKAAIVDAVAAIEDAVVVAAAGAAASAADRVHDDADRDGAFAGRWITDVPIAIVADLVGIDRFDVVAAVASARDLAAGFGPLPPDDAEGIARRAVTTLTTLATASVTVRTDGLTAALARALPDERLDDAVANAVGLLFQTADATAGLAGNTLVRLMRDGGTTARPLADVVADVAVSDPSVHNTRRFFAGRADVAGVTIEGGQTVLVVLAAADRDPERDGSLSFGLGTHHCPAGALAPRIAQLAVAELVAAWPDVLTSIAPAGYRPLPNVRVPQFE